MKFLFAIFLMSSAFCAQASSKYRVVCQKGEKLDETVRTLNSLIEKVMDGAKQKGFPEPKVSAPSIVIAEGGFGTTVPVLCVTVEEPQKL
jgi:hypothetical protein